MDGTSSKVSPTIFFLDIEDRIRSVLQPPAKPTKPYTFHTDFYLNPNASAPGVRKKRTRAPDRLVTKQMKIFKEQWAGMGLAFDMSLVKGDMQMAGAVWRNLLGARGAQGIAYPSPSSSSPNFRRSVNLIGGEVVDVTKLNLEKEEAIDDGSGVHDFPPEQADRYLSYPTVMLDIVGYVRRELVRLQAVSDEDILDGDFEQLKFGKVTRIARKVERGLCRDPRSTQLATPLSLALDWLVSKPGLTDNYTLRSC